MKEARIKNFEPMNKNLIQGRVGVRGLKCTLTLRMNVCRNGKSGGREMKVMCLTPGDPANIRACLRESVNGPGSKRCRWSKKVYCRKSAEAIVGISRRAEQINKS